MPSSTLITPTAITKERHQGEESESPYNWAVQARNESTGLTPLRPPVVKQIRPEARTISRRRSRTRFTK
jgi:hypothetical protein